MANYTLGINAYHGDSAAALFFRTELIAAIEEERIRRIKHWAGLPVEAVRFCLEEAGIGLEEVDVLAVSRDPYAKIGAKIWHLVRQGINPGALTSRAKNAVSLTTIKQDLATAFGLNPATWKARVEFVEHHRSHLASAFYVSPFEQAALLSVDGMGDFSSTMRAVGHGNKITVLDSVPYPHSLGIFYTAFTQYLGFPNYGDEYKVMGLAPYGKPVFFEKLKKVIRLKSNGLFALNGRYFSHFKNGVQMNWDGGAPIIGPIFTEQVVSQFGPARKAGEPLGEQHADLAASIQKMCETVLFHLINDLHQKTGLRDFCLAGGVAQNSVANGKVRENTSVERLFVPPAGHDAGTSIGAALYVLHHKNKLLRPGFAHQAYTGARANPDAIRSAIEARGMAFQHLADAPLFDLVTDCLAAGGVAGWYQGRAEFGPRALGNRSILADPRRADARELLNQKIKRRESFRPFAPSILAEFAAAFFENPDKVPFMEKVYRIRPDKRVLIPAVTHVDGSGRLQTVARQDNPRYYELISAFHRKTGIPVLLNTSFNENEPIVNTPEEALDCFCRTEMDMLVMENFVVRR